MLYFKLKGKAQFRKCITAILFQCFTNCMFSTLNLRKQVMNEKRDSPDNMLIHMSVWVHQAAAGCCHTNPIPFTRPLKERGKFQTTLSLFSCRKFSELQFMLRPVNSRKNPNFCHRRWGSRVTLIRSRSQAKQLWSSLSTVPQGKYGKALHFAVVSPPPPSDLQKGKGKGKIRVETTRNYCCNLALVRICKPSPSR